MNLEDLHRQLSRKPGYRRAYAEIGDAVTIGNHVCAAREAEKLSRRALAFTTGLPVALVASVEEGEPGTDPDVLSVIFERLAEPLRARGASRAPLRRA